MPDGCLPPTLPVGPWPFHFCLSFSQKMPLTPEALRHAAVGEPALGCTEQMLELSRIELQKTLIENTTVGPDNAWEGLTLGHEGTDAWAGHAGCSVAETETEKKCDHTSLTLGCDRDMS